MPPRRSRVEPFRADALADAPRDDWTRELGWILDLDLASDEVPEALRNLQGALESWGALDRVAAVRTRRVTRIPHPLWGVLVGLVGAVSMHLSAVVMREGRLDQAVFPALIVGIVVSLGFAGLKRALGRKLDAGPARARATEALRRLGGRSALLVVGEQIVEVRAWLSRLLARQEEARTTLSSASQRLREVETTTAQIRSSNTRLGRPLDDSDTHELVALRSRLAGEIQALMVVSSEIDRRRISLESRVDGAAAEAERYALSRRAASLAERPAALPQATWTTTIEAVDAEVEALERAVTEARARLTAVEGSARAATRRPTSVRA